MTGYALAFPKHSKHAQLFNDKILEMRENGDLERLGRFWMSGMCKPNEQEKKASEPGVQFNHL
jgi:ionotropic glutamate receptor NMDA 2B